MKKIRISRELVYVLSIIIMSMGVALMTKADFGVSMVVAPAYILSLKLGFLTFGQAEYCIQLILVILMCIIIRRFRISYFFSFVTAFIYGAVLDGFICLLNLITLDDFAFRVFLCACGAVITSLSVAMFFRTYLSPCAYDQFVKVVAIRFRFNLNHFKILYDLTSLGISAIMTLSFFGEFEGIGPATIICAFVNGVIIGLFGKAIDKHFEFYDRFKFAKFFENKN